MAASFCASRIPKLNSNCTAPGEAKEQIPQRVGRNGPKNNFAFRERFFFGGSAEENFAFAVPLAGSQRGDMGFPEVLVAARDIYAAGNDTENGVGRLAGVDDRLLIIFDESSIRLKLGDKLAAHACKQAIAGEDQLPRARLLFG